MVTLRVTDVNEMPVLENDFEEDKDNPANYAENGAGPWPPLRPWIPRELA